MYSPNQEAHRDHWKGYFINGRNQVQIEIKDLEIDGIMSGITTDGQSLDGSINK